MLAALTFKNLLTKSMKTREQLWTKVCRFKSSKQHKKIGEALELEITSRDSASENVYAIVEIKIAQILKEKFFHENWDEEFFKSLQFQSEFFRKEGLISPWNLANLSSISSLREIILEHGLSSNREASQSSKQDL